MKVWEVTHQRPIGFTGKFEEVTHTVYSEDLMHHWANSPACVKIVENVAGVRQQIWGLYN